MQGVPRARRYLRRCPFVLMLLVRPLLFLLFLMAASPILAQPDNDDCEEAVNLCAPQPVAGSNAGANGSLPSFCPLTDDMVWYTFTTNSVGGEVDISVTGVDCLQQPGMGDEVSVVALSGDGLCTPGAFLTASDSCVQSSVDFSIPIDSLPANTQFWVVVAGETGPGLTAAQCSFNISISGPGADIIGVDFSAGPDVTLDQGGSTQLLATGGGPLYDWSPLAGLSGNLIPDPFATPEESTLYSVTTEINGCTYTDQVFIEVNRPISPPNTITPNGDDINDTWEIFGIEDYPQATVSIFDRWGQRVFNSVGYKTPFDGKGLPTATYYWIIQLSQLDGVSEPYTGFLTIVN